jgi:hypothetical protein
MTNLLSTTSGLTWADLLANRGISMSALGAAYIVLGTNALLAAPIFMVCRTKLVISPNRASRDYGLFMAVLLVSLMVAATLENQLSAAPLTLPYSMFPHLVLLFVIHLWIYYHQEPWLIALGFAATASLVFLVALFGYLGDGARLAHWVTIAIASALLVFVWLRAVTTKRAFVKSSSTIYALSKEVGQELSLDQTPWLGLPQWVALVTASIALAMVNELLVGVGLTEMPAVQVISQAGLVMAITALVSGIPATTYWLARKSWMPELTRFVWIVWLVVGFALTYGNYLLRLQSA